MATEADNNAIPMSKRLCAVPRTNSDVVCELASERRVISNNLERIYTVIKANPETVSARQKDLLHMQAKAMQDYIDVLGLRIKDLIDSDT